MKMNAEGTAGYKQACADCSSGLLQEYFQFVSRIKEKLQKLRPSSTAFWKISNLLMHKPDSAVAIPALKRSDGTWARSALDKAKEFVIYL